MSSDDLEYHVQFPSCTPKELSPVADDGFVHVRNHQKCPVVVLLGWIGCRDKNLARYSEIYDERGCITIRCCVPPMVLMFNHHKYPNMARKLLDMLTDMSFDEHPIFFHVFSNGGCFLYQYVVNEMKSRNSTLDVRGSIMDSAPGKMRSSSVFKTIMTLPIGIKPFRIFFALFACFWMSIVNLSMLFLKKFVDDSHLSGDVFGNLVDSTVKFPSLFIYSEDDYYVKYQDIEDFINEREKRGCRISRCRFSTSTHVAHLLKHRDDYVDHISDFLTSCLRQKQQ